jgi:S1-C subfamily serine protease
LSSAYPALAAQNQLSEASGVLIVKVAPQGAAARAGLKPDDVIVQIGKNAVTDVASLVDALIKMNPGDLVPVRIYRGEEQLTVNVTLGEVQIQ